MKRRMSWLLVALAALLAFPAAASAAPQPFNVTFDEARLQLNNGVVDEDEPTTDTTFTNGTIDDQTGDITVPQNGVNIARFTTSTGAPVIAQPNEAYTGNYNAQTGEFTLGGNTNVVVPTSQTGGCVFPGLEINFSTDDAAPSGDFEGTPFTDGLEGEIGSAVTSFTDLPPVQTYGAGDPAQCNLLQSLADGPGALQIGNDISLTPVAFEWEANRLQLNNGVFDDESAGSSNFEGTFDVDNNALNIPQANVNLAQFTSTQGAPVVPAAEEDYTGTYDPETGDLELGGETQVTVVTGQTSGCRFSDLDLNFSTDNDAPSGDFTGVPFDDGLDGATGAAVATLAGIDSVTTLGTPPIDCEALRTANDGPSAVSIGNEIGPPAQPPADPSLNVNSTPASAKIKQGASKTFKVKVNAEDATGPTTAKVCATVPGGKKGLKLQGSKCKNVGGVYDEAKTVSFKVKSTKKTAPKKYNLKFKATATGYTAGQDSSKLQVQKKKRRRG